MKIFLVPGSKRQGSHNLKLLELTQKQLQALGHATDLFDFKKADIPVYDEDVLQAGVPKAVQDFKDRVKAADAVLLASPEYNYSVPGPVKNLIDWASRPPPTNPFRGKVVGQMGATPGGGGTLQAQQQIRHILTMGVGAHVLPGLAFTLSRADQAFDERGELKDESHRKQLADYLSRFIAEVVLRAGANR